ncbi:MAG: hypothetical protein AB1498_11725 [bacterium]
MKFIKIKIDKNFRMAVILFFLTSAGTGTNAGGNLLQAQSVIQISSDITDGKYSIQEIIDIAKINDIKVVMLTDRDFMSWEYGFWPLRKIIKKKVESNSMQSYGIEKYLREIEEIQKKNPDIVLIAGVESAPFYYWDGKPFRDNFKIIDWHKHMLVFGLNKAEDYKNLPSVANKKSLLLPFKLKNIYLFWPVPVLIVGFLCLRKRKFKYKDSQGNSLGPYSLPWQVFGGLCLFAGLIFFINNYPFHDFKYDQYHGAQGISPYQNFINYVNQKGGMSFWAHPEIENIMQYDEAKVETKEYPEYLLESRNYTGWTIFYEGDEKVGPPGGIWDKVLKNYCMTGGGLPVWAIGGLGFDQAGNFNEAVKDLRTVFLVPQINRESILSALKNGKMYVVKGRDCGNFILESFVVKDSLSGVNGTIADELNLKGKPVINIKGRIINWKNNEKITVKLIKDGVIVKLYEVNSPFEVSYTDEYFYENKKSYYRLEINTPERVLVSNPVFVSTLLR